MSDRKRVYIAGPISKGCMLHNIQQAEEAFFALARAGLAPWCPHWSVYAKSAVRHEVNLSVGPFSFVYASAAAQPPGTTHEDWMGVDLPWVRVSDAVLRLPGESVGADAEVVEAVSAGIPVFHTADDVLAYFGLVTPNHSE